jgi:hypothetical protein|tara:strand:+ start:26 stop:172 length:147 start_codon:yes stop_codon:yes gene_type:complete
MALLFIENGSALCYKENKMVDKKDDEEVEEEKYEQLEFEFDEDLVAPI